MVWTLPGDFPAIICTTCNYGIVGDTVEQVVLRHNHERAVVSDVKSSHFPTADLQLHYAVDLLVALLPCREVQDGIDALVHQGKLPADKPYCVHRAGPAHCAGLEKDFAELSGTLANLVLKDAKAGSILKSGQTVEQAKALDDASHKYWSEINERAKKNVQEHPDTVDLDNARGKKAAQAKLAKMSREQILVGMSLKDFYSTECGAIPKVSEAEWRVLIQDRLKQLDELDRRVAEKKAKMATPSGLKTATVKKPTKTTVKKGVVPAPPARKSIQARVPCIADENEKIQAMHLPPKGSIILVLGSDEAVAAQQAAQKTKVLAEQDKAKEQDDHDPKATEALQTKLRSIAKVALQRSGNILVKSQTQVIRVLYREQGNLYEISSILGNPHGFVVQRVVYVAGVSNVPTKLPGQDMEAVLGIATPGPNNEMNNTVWYDRIDLRPRDGTVAAGPSLHLCCHNVEAQVSAGPTLASIVDTTKPAEPEKDQSNA
jgi:hypothetical protein